MAARSWACSPRPSPEPMRRCDVVVVGQGIFGLAAHTCLVARGLSVIALEHAAPGHDGGASHGDSRVTRRANFENPAYAPLFDRSVALWRDLETEAGEIYRPTGVLHLYEHVRSRIRRRPAPGAAEHRPRLGLLWPRLQVRQRDRRNPDRPGDEPAATLRAGDVRPGASRRAGLNAKALNAKPPRPGGLTAGVTWRASCRPTGPLDPGGLGGLFRIRDQRRPDQPTVGRWWGKQARAGRN